MGQLRKIKRANQNPSTNKKVNKQMVQASWDLGYNTGAKEQRKSDIKYLFKILEELESIPGIGEKTAWKIRELFLNKFGVKDDEQTKAQG